MVVRLPANAPKTANEAFARVRELRNGATLDDLPILALTEALGKQLYEDLAASAQQPEVKTLLRENGREELAHAHRVSKAIELLTGEPFVIPPIEDNPFYTRLAPKPLTKALLTKLAEGEFAGQALYAGVAASFDNAEAAALFRLNGAEELEHGARLEKAAALLPA